MKEVNKVMQLKGHKVRPPPCLVGRVTNLFACSESYEKLTISFFQSAVTCLCFALNSEQIITASKDGTIRVWNINGMFYYFNQNVMFYAAYHHILDGLKQ